MTRSMRWIGFLATILILVTLTMAALREPASQARAADLQLRDAISEGTTLYLEYCVSCHGGAGEGISVYPALNAAASMDPDVLLKTIERGRYNTQMAAYGIDEGGVLSRTQVESLVTLIQHGDWLIVHGQAELAGVLPPELVVAEIPYEMIAQVNSLPGGEILSTGLMLYAENCTACHGANMDGTTLAPALNTDDLRAKDSFEIVRLIEQGVPGTLMAGWDNALNDAQANALTSLILRWSEIQTLGISIPLVEAQPLDMSPEAIASGDRLFNILCSSCHGMDGYGSPMAPALNNALFLTTTSDVQIHQIIRMGVGGTVMPAWGGRLSEAQINEIIAFLRSMEPSAPTITQPR